jgi:hypothetical protein
MDETIIETASADYSEILARLDVLVNTQIVVICFLGIVAGAILSFALFRWLK